MCENQSFLCHAAPWWKENKLSPSFLPFFSPSAEFGPSCSWRYRKPTQTGTRRRWLSCITLRTEKSWNCKSNLYFTCSAPREQAPNLCFWIYWRQKKDSHQIPSAAQKKNNAEFMTSSCPTTSHFMYTTLLYIYPPSTTEIFPSPELWTLIAGDFPSWAAYNFFE